MRRFAIVAATVALAAAVWSCGSGDSPTGPASSRTAMPGLTALPAGVCLDSAHLVLTADAASEPQIGVHRVTADWMETSVTWNSLGANFDTLPAASFALTDSGEVTVDVTALVTGWLDGTSENFGLLLNQTVPAPVLNRFDSRENLSTGPVLKLFCSAGDSDLVEMLAATADAYIAADYPDSNFGTEDALYTGSAGEEAGQNRSLIKFDIAIEVPMSKLGDRVWFDENGDGIQDSMETGLADVVVNLYDCFDTLLATTMTDAEGMYSFDSLLPRGYVLEFMAPFGYFFSPMMQGDDPEKDSDADPETGRTTCIALELGVEDLSHDAGLYMPTGGCTYGKGYWKNHAGFGPQADVLSPLLPLTLGTDGGEKSLLVDTREIAVDVLKQFTYGRPSNGITKLYAHLLTAKLNIVNGASGADILEAVEAADAFLAEHSWEDWDMLSKSDRQDVQCWKGKFESYNEGDIGPGSCDDKCGYDHSEDDGDVE